MIIAWQSSMETGAPVLDAQHRALVERAGRLIGEIRNGSDRPTVERALRDFGDYAVRHFSQEEDCHLRGICPAVRWTGVARAELIRIVADLRLGFEREGATPALATSMSARMSEWVDRYIPGPCPDLPCVEAARHDLAGKASG
jgi:hemerythrin-like metal-binding protein